MKNNIRNLKKYLRLFFTGFTMGAADIVPGVSGGTVAFLLGIYEELIQTIKILTGEVLKLFFIKFEFLNAIKKIPFSFALPLGFGLLTAVFSLSKAMQTLLNHYPVLVWSFFFGLVLASAWVVRKRVTNWDLKSYIFLIATTVFAYWLTGLVPTETPNHPVVIFLSGAIAICAMILPGISGSFLLVILGKYEYILSAVTDLNFKILTIFILGIIFGISLFSRVLSWLFKKYHDITIAALIGFMIGSLRKVWPYKETLLSKINSDGQLVVLLEKNVLPPTLNLELFFVIFLAVLGFFIVWFLESLQLTKERSSDLNDPEFKKEHPNTL